MAAFYDFEFKRFDFKFRGEKYQNYVTEVILALPLAELIKRLTATAIKSDEHRTLNTTDNSHQTSKKRNRHWARKKNSHQRTQAQISVQLKIMFVDILIAYPSEEIRHNQLPMNLNT